MKRIASQTKDERQTNGQTKKAKLEQQQQAGEQAGKEEVCEESVGGVVRKLITDAQWQLADGDGAAPQATLKFEQMAQQGAQGSWVAGGASWLAEVAKSLPVV